MESRQHNLSERRERSDRRRAELLTAKEAARVLRIGQTKLYELLRRREIPYAKIGKATRIFRSGVIAYLEAHRIGDSSKGG